MDGILVATFSGHIAALPGKHGRRLLGRTTGNPGARRRATAARFQHGHARSLPHPHPRKSDAAKDKGEIRLLFKLG